MSLDAHGISAWGFSPGGMSEKAFEDSGVGICVAAMDDEGPSINVYSDGEKIVGVLVCDGDGNRLAGWGLVPAWEAQF